ncbi:MAG: V-type ATP synthase subunit D [Bacillota bacterium]|nr:V-type ATP synthase subunit D [Bacillota bacterium]MDW7728995.1 V-type ATP synthase subunit D [Bacillota bacterium]
MAKIKYTKNELKKQKDQLKRFRRYLPTLILKKQLLQMEIRQVEMQINEKNQQRERINAELMSWVHVFGENLNIAELVKVKETDLETTNIAGVDIPVFNKVIYENMPYDLMFYPLWVDAGVQKLKELFSADMELTILKKQAELLGEELRITSQRVNLFEKVKIPDTTENIRRINIFLGDQQTAAVVRGKLSKNKLVREA